MQFSFWQVYYCSSAISFFDGFRSLPCFLQLQKKRTAVGLLLRLFRKIFAVHRYLTATHIGYSPQARHRVNCPKGKRRSLGDTRVAQLVCRVLIVHPVEIYVHFPFPVSIFNLVLFTLNSPLFTLYETPTSSLLTPTLRNLSHLDTCILRQLLLSYKDVRSD